MKVILAKMVGEGEQVNLEMNVPSDILKDAESGKVGRLKRFMAPAYLLIDDRLVTLNQRILDAMGYIAKLPEDIRPHVNFATRAAIDLLYGRNTTGQTPVTAEAIQKDQEAIQKAQVESSLKGESTHPFQVVQGGKDNLGERVTRFLNKDQESHPIDSLSVLGSDEGGEA